MLVADPEGVQGFARIPSPPSVFKYPMKINNLLSLRPNYFIFMGYLRKMRTNQQSETPLLYTYAPPFQKSLIRPYWPMKCPTLINWMTKFRIKELLGSKFQFHSNFIRTFCKQTVKNLTKRPVLWRLLGLCAVCRCPL